MKLNLHGQEISFLSNKPFQTYHSSAVARFENPGGLVVLGGDNVSPLVEIGLTDLPKSGGATASAGMTGLRSMYYLFMHLLHK